jgi:hypothetical protein
MWQMIAAPVKSGALSGSALGSQPGELLGGVMRVIRRFVSTVTVVMLSTVGFGAQAQDNARAVAGGGIFVPGWVGKIDANEERAGQVLNNSRLARAGDVLQVTTGPAVTYWNPANRAVGNYTVKATFTEPKYMNLNDHAHPEAMISAPQSRATCIAPPTATAPSSCADSALPRFRWAAGVRKRMRRCTRPPLRDSR